MKTSSTRVTRLNRRARILLAAGGAVLVIALVAVALLAFDPPLVARLSHNLPGAATSTICTPGGNCPDSCAYKTVPTWCGSAACTLVSNGSCEGTDLTYVLSNSQLMLSNASLEKCNLRESALTGSLVGAKLGGAHLNRAILTGADLTKADLTGADLTEAYLIDANLTNADLTDADLTNATTSGTIWDGVTYCRTKMPDGTVNNSGCP